MDGSSRNTRGKSGENIVTSQMTPRKGDPENDKKRAHGVVEETLEVVLKRRPR